MAAQGYGTESSTSRAPASELHNQPVVTQNDLFELPVRLNG